MINVLFVCLGNICRSPMGEAVLRHKAQERGLGAQIRVDSAGTGDWHIGKPPHEGTLKQLKLHGISGKGLKARQIGERDFEAFDYIVCMDDSNERNLRKLAGGAHVDILKFMDLLPQEKLREVPDPYYTGNFAETYRLMDAGCEALLDKIAEEKL
ncbi:low molecular weight protein-tyrosine-phosphatase [Paenibacillus farraposensis]|uniref:protein-tyrosine-phosphatase n=1 Tax=Paenibacillus farraposensis TaxID=2807095 RepID=A0ABW4DBW0_9BACL|nr:low molecular weight protein-tyrosine-phosphatase [Paenibacillus farraposensis]MCC3381127.1 low molecular weight phosphotyrosine protein phosphatase [Paenibacillus farraposensis]